MSKTILITETQSGAGLAIAQTLAEGGYSVIAAMPCCSVPNTAMAVLQQPNIEVVDMDIRQDDSVFKTVERMLKKYGQIDGLITNTTEPLQGTFEALSVEHSRTLLETDLFGLMRICQAVLPGMRDRRCGLVVNLIDDTHSFQDAHAISYRLSAHSREVFTEALRHEAQPQNIEVISVWAETFPARANLIASDTVSSSPNERYQQIAHAVSILVNMKKGTRPNQTLLS